MEIAITIPKSSRLVSQTESSPPDAASARDKSLLQAYELGDNDAFTSLYNLHAQTVYQFALYMSADVHKADEITQEVFVWLLDHAGAFDPARGSLPAFLGGVARKFLRRHWRKDGRWFSLDEAIPLLTAFSIAHEPPPSADLVLDIATLRQAIARLPMRYREVIVLCDLQEKQYAEAAQTLACSIGTVRSRLHRGRNLLARKLSSTYHGDRNGL